MNVLLWWALAAQPNAQVLPLNEPTKGERS